VSRRPAPTIAAHLVPPRAPETVYLGLGSNIGDRLHYLRQGLFALLAHPEIRVKAVSRAWESAYVGPGEQAPYLNLVCAARTELAPAALLAVCKGVEQRLGRAPAGHMLPRTLDLDILLFGDRRGGDALLTLPHPRLAERGFVLGPLAELAPTLVLPDSGETAAAAWARIRAEDGSWLRPLEDPVIPASAAEGREEEWRAALAVHCR
jgi:2-amino-4-hydroxy-6-hydroxymethyldihydropteridine diphosphokinase